jgi:hypothetical protein
MSFSTDVGTNPAPVSIGIGNNGTPYIFPVSTQNNPNNQTVTFTSNWPWYYRIFDLYGNRLAEGQFIGTLEQGAQPYPVTFTLPIKFPNFISVSIVDATIMQERNYQSSIPVFGGDTFNVKVLYAPNFPELKQVLVNGAPMLINLRQLNLMALLGSDVIPVSDPG